MAAIQNIFRVILAFFRWPRRPNQPVEAVIVVTDIALPTAFQPPANDLPTPEPLIELPPPKLRVRRRSKLDMRLKATILDQLDDNTKIVGRMKACFPSEYGLYSTIGAVIVPHDDAFIDLDDLVRHPVSPWFNETRPAFGAVVTGNPNDENSGMGHTLYARLTHFLKIQQPSDVRRQMFRRGHAEVQPVAKTSDFYIFTMYFDERDWAKVVQKKSRADWKCAKFYERAFAIELPIEITKDGQARPLKIMREKYVIPPSRKDYYSDRRKTVKRWDYPYSKSCLAEMAKDEKWKDVPSPEKYIITHAAVAMRSYEEAQASIIQVRASKNDICTLVNIDVETTPDFFNDREDVIEGNVKKRIFHIVRAHPRVGSKGVRVHFRGLREFVWNGYQIGISVPGRDHLDVKEFNVTAIREEDDDGREKTSDLGDIGEWLVASQKARFGAMVGKSGKLPPLASRPPSA